MDDQKKLFAALRWETPPALVQTALTHPSFRNEAKGRVEDYERLEFLGDAVLQLCVSERLAAAFPKAKEGELSRMRSALVRADTLAEFARRVGVGGAIRVGRGARASGERDQTNVLADVVEALVGAAYLDGGLERARDLVGLIVEGKVSDAASLEARDAKSELQERVQGEGRPTPHYRVEAIVGPDQDRWFDVAVVVGDEVLAVGRGRSKKLAEQEAARGALRLLVLPCRVGSAVLLSLGGSCLAAALLSLGGPCLAWRLLPGGGSSLAWRSLPRLAALAWRRLFSRLAVPASGGGDSGTVGSARALRRRPRAPG